MDWKSYFTQNKEISTEVARQYIETSKPGTIQLLDVRQPQEYKDNHIPGALLIPLNSLPLRLDELDRNKETVVYCRSGARSRSACQLLLSNGFENVANMTGGMLQWQGYTATGTEKFGLDFFVAGTFVNAFSMAISMEAGLQEFYKILAANSKQENIATLLNQMARFEDGHIAKLKAMYKKTGADEELKITSSVLEGGISQEDLWSTFGDQLNSPEEVLQLGMTFEAQAYDMYTRMSRNCDNEPLRQFYLQMADEEQKHLDKLAAELDNLLR